MQLPTNTTDFKKAVEQDHFYSIHGKDLDTFFETFLNNIRKAIPESHAIYLELELKAMDQYKVLISLLSYSFSQIVKINWIFTMFS
jgi:hypothetical protein